MSPDLVRQPIDDPRTAPYWEGFLEEEIRLPYCTECDSFHWYPKYRCPTCGSTAIEWTAISGQGTLFTWVEIRYHFRIPFLEGKLPLYSGLVVPDEAGSIRIPAVIDVPETTDPEIGMRLAVEFQESDMEAGLQYPVYRPG